MSQNSQAAYSTRSVASDYGDFTVEEQEIINGLLANIIPEYPTTDEPLELTDIEDYEEPRGVHLPKTLGKELWTPPWMHQRPQAEVAPHITVEDQASRNTGSTTTVDSAAQKRKAERERSASVERQSDASKPDTRSPIERFRTKPKKALSVTDLVSPAWCELQYFYTLSKHGKKRATPAMRQGTKVHKKLEDEVHTTVPVEITTKEDSWGLRIWNIIQGLRTLQETGKTRELEVWGVVDGEIVNGVIDELSYACPDPAFAEQEAQRLAKGREAKDVLPENQTSMDDYLLSSSGGNGKTFSQLGTGIENSIEPPSISQPVNKRLQDRRLEDKKIYITDMKTRSVKSLPSALAARPTEIQLQLYHSMLNSLAQDKVPLSTFAQRYNFDPAVQFSDSFIAQVGSLNEQFFDAISSQPQSDNTATGASDIPASSQDSIDILLKHNTIQSLWRFMVSQFQETLLLSPIPSSSSLPSPPHSETDLPTRLSPLLTASYIHSSTHTHLGNKSFTYSPSDLSTYISDEMAWWRGERKARGVEIQEVNAKCTRCEFLAECEWIRDKEREVREKKKPAD
ncbi:hypothetical protein GJ744_007266 [Endocarpon pusillum]|uniref:Exonuclease V n=1 Tax=Endocarpon pusillum TaxID=364733 RepID=A0A8H7E5D6_9EURO|nr:hypothetical protein GJ744_007266 [Endocarpon pusillum]